MLDVREAVGRAPSPRVVSVVSPIWIDALSPSSLARALHLREAGHQGPIQYMSAAPNADEHLFASSRAEGVEPLEYDHHELRAPDGSALTWHVNDLVNAHLRRTLIDRLRDTGL